MKKNEVVGFIGKSFLVESLLFIFIYGVMFITLYSSRVEDSILATITTVVMSVIVLFVFVIARRWLK